MRITLRYSVITKENTVIPEVTEVFECPDEESKAPARARWKELQDARFVANLEYKIEDVESYRIVETRYVPKGTIYRFKVNFDVKKGQGLEVDDLDVPDRRKYVFAIGTDHIVTREELGFDPKRLRDAYKPA